MVTKRMLGIGFIVVGVILIIGILAVDLFRAGNFMGLGPLQLAAISGAALIVVVGVSLLPLGNRPA